MNGNTAKLIRRMFPDDRKKYRAFKHAYTQSNVVRRTYAKRMAETIIATGKPVKTADMSAQDS